MPDPATKRGGACNKPPKLSLTVVTSATAGEPVAVLGSVQPGTGQPGCAIVAWSLDFGDGAALAGTAAGTITTRHSYGTPGSYTIELVAESDSGPPAAPVYARIEVTAAPIIEPPPVEPPIEPVTEPALVIPAPRALRLGGTVPTISLPMQSKYGPQWAIQPPAGAIDITAGASIQGAINAAGPGQAFRLRAGTHPITASLVAKSGQSFTGEYGAILDASGGSEADLDEAVFRAVNTGVTNVLLRNLYLKDGPCYAVNAYLNATGWRIEYCEISGFRNGVSLGHNGVLTRSFLHHNAGTPYPAEAALRGGNFVFSSSAGLVITHNEISYGGQEQKIIYSVGGFPNQGHTITNNFVHHNQADGLWFDGDGAGSVLADNICDDNTRTGITMELGNRVIIQNNICRRNGDEGILLTAARECTVSGNRLENNWLGLGLFLDYVRLEEDYGFWVTDLTGNTIQHNEIHVGSGTAAAGLSLSGTGDATPYLNNTKNNRFQSNRYFAPSTGGGWFAWNGTKTFAQWQTVPQDSLGTITAE